MCPRCKGSLPYDARSCPRCGLVIAPRTTTETPAPATPRAALNDVAPFEAPVPARNGKTNGALATGSSPYSAAPATPAAQPRPQRTRQTGPLNSSPALSYKPGNTGPLVPRGALELLPGESVVFQLGALYLTTKRVILLAPSVVRSAFVRDIDAVGTFTERSSAWVPIFGVLLLALSAGGFYIIATQQEWRATLSLLFDLGIMLPILAGLLGLWSLFLLARYFFWSKRTLFVSVKGRPLITVSIADWNQRKLEGMDSFVNAFFGIKDLMTGELGEIEQ